jgi:hypothetical protein
VDRLELEQVAATAAAALASLVGEAAVPVATRALEVLPETMRQAHRAAAAEAAEPVAGPTAAASDFSERDRTVLAAPTPWAAAAAQAARTGPTETVAMLAPTAEEAEALGWAASVGCASSGRAT